MENDRLVGVRVQKVEKMLKVRRSMVEERKGGEEEKIKKQSWRGEESEKKREVKCRKTGIRERRDKKVGGGRRKERTTGLPPVFLKKGPCNVCVL